MMRKIGDSTVYIRLQDWHIKYKAKFSLKHFVELVQGFALRQHEFKSLYLFKYSITVKSRI